MRDLQVCLSLDIYSTSGWKDDVFIVAAFAGLR